MQNDLVTSLLDDFNKMIDSLIDDFKEFNADEDALAFIAKRTRNFITSTDLALTNIVFTVLETIENDFVDYAEEIKESKALVKDIFNKINEWIDHILEHEEEEQEHVHNHDHHHHHHVHVDIDEVQDDITYISEYLLQLKSLFNSIIDVLRSSSKYQSNDISQEDYENDCANFKNDINDIKNNLG